jgi:hypothetical protein
MSTLVLLDPLVRLFVICGKTRREISRGFQTESRTERSLSWLMRAVSPASQKRHINLASFLRALHAACEMPSVITTGSMRSTGDRPIAAAAATNPFARERRLQDRARGSAWAHGHVLPRGHGAIGEARDLRRAPVARARRNLRHVRVGRDGIRVGEVRGRGSR